MDNALLPCPFCKSSQVEEAMRTGAIVCQDCGASAPSKRQWNTREAAEDLVKAAHKLSIELLGQMEFFEIELRQVIGDSNFTSLAQHAFEAEAAIARAKGGL